MRTATRWIGCTFGIVLALCVTAGEPPTGLLYSDDRVQPGRTLVAPIPSPTTHLIDTHGEVVAVGRATRRRGTPPT